MVTAAPRFQDTFCFASEGSRNLHTEFCITADQRTGRFVFRDRICSPGAHLFLFSPQRRREHGLLTPCGPSDKLDLLCVYWAAVLVSRTSHYFWWDAFDQLYYYWLHFTGDPAAKPVCAHFMWRWSEKERENRSIGGIRAVTDKPTHTGTQICVLEVLGSNTGREIYPDTVFCG
jgi:hypothetical protein